MSSQFNITIESSLKEYMDETQVYIDRLKDNLIKKIIATRNQSKLNIFQYSKTMPSPVATELKVVAD